MVSRDGSVDATESRLCTDREFDTIAPGETALTEEQVFAKMTTGKGRCRADFRRDRPERRSRFQAERFADATAGGGMMPKQDYDRWRGEGLYVRPTQ